MEDMPTSLWHQIKQNKKAEISLSAALLKNMKVEDYALQLEFRKRLLRALELPSVRNQLILDAGCGRGLDGIILALQENQTIGVDISSEAIRMAKYIAKKSKADFTPMIGDLEGLGFKDDSFDFCMCLWVLHHFPVLQGLMEELTRVLKMGGKIVLVEPNRSSITIALSRRMEKVLSKVVMSFMLDTPNEEIHSSSDYVKILRRCGLSKINVIFPRIFDPALKGRIPHQNVHPLSLTFLYIILFIRFVLLPIFEKILPSIFASNVLIIAKKT